MRYSPRLPGLVAVWLLTLMGVTGRVVGQVADSARLPRGVVIGHVTDTVGRPVPEVEVAVTRESDSLVMAVGRTDSQGITRLPQVPAGGPYTVLARAIGYQPIRTPGMHIREGDTLKVPFVLRPHAVVLPEVMAGAKVPRLLIRGGFLGIRLFKCLFIGIGEVDERAAGCTQNAGAHAARRAARAAAQEVQKVTRRVEKANGAGRRPDPDDALVVLNTARACSREIPKRPPWPRPDPDVRCREILERIPRESLERLGKALAAMEVTEPFEAERRRLKEAERRQLAEGRARKLDKMLAEAEAKYMAQVINEAAGRVDMATKAGHHPDSMDAFLVHAAAEDCGREVPADEVLCRAILKRTPKKTLGRLVQALVADGSVEQRDTAQVVREEQPTRLP